MKLNSFFPFTYFPIIIFPCTFSPKPNKALYYVLVPNISYLIRHSILVTGHSSFVFIANSFQFFDEYNSKLLESSNYITRRQAVKVCCHFVA